MALAVSTAALSFSRIIAVDLNPGKWTMAEALGHVMRSAPECCHKGWGESVIIGVAGLGY
jgi:Zn-dependent alcohol dehydrogenase